MGIAIDALLAYLLTRLVAHIWLRLLLAIFVGVSVAVLVNSGAYLLFFPDEPIGVLAAAIIGGSFWHPFFILVFIGLGALFKTLFSGKTRISSPK